MIQLLGMWNFHDERPLPPDEVAAAIRECGEVVFQKTLWPLLLTQQLIIARKRASGHAAAQGTSS
jgi:hypothetical protein